MNEDTPVGFNTDDGIRRAAIPDMAKMYDDFSKFQYR